MSNSAYIGKVLDNYRIVEIIGEGGMGVVFKAIHTKLDKLVALKLIAPGLSANSKFIRRFQTEARALAKLQNPNIVTIHDLRSFENQWFITMEYVDGKDLFDIIDKEGAYNWQESIAIAKQILSAIGHAHKAGIIHRDLKPHNIMISENNLVKITDFGLAKDETSEMNTITVASGGTLNYMSPEHVKGFSYIEKRSDLYCIGIILYEMVTGEVPFKNLDSDFDIRESILRKDFDTPTKINKKIPIELEEIIMKSIAKPPKDRFQSAEEMLQAIYDFEKGNKFTYTKKSKLEILKPSPAKIAFSVLIIMVIAVMGYYSGYFTSKTVDKITQNEQIPVLSINTIPSNAIIHLNNDSIGVTPLGNYKVIKGTYSIKLTKESFNVIDTSITIEQGKNLNLNFDLSPKEIVKIKEDTKTITKPVSSSRDKISEFASLKINSTPTDADVIVNSQFRGKTPLTLNELNVGNYQIRLQKNGFEDYVNNLNLQKADNQKLDVGLNQISGRLLVRTIPENVTLSIDGETREINGGNINLPGIPIGKKKIRISKSGYTDFISEVEIQRNKETSINATLMQLVGKLIVKIRPWGRVYLNDQIQKNVTDTKFENELAVDKYKLRIEHPTLGYWQKDITITKDTETTILVNFTKKIPVSISAFGENGEPFAGNIIIDGKSTGKTTPQEIKVPVGLHKIVVEKQGFKALNGQREILIEENYKDPLVFIFKENKSAN